MSYRAKQFDKNKDFYAGVGGYVNAVRKTGVGGHIAGTVAGILALPFVALYGLYRLGATGVALAGDGLSALGRGAKSLGTGFVSGVKSAGTWVVENATKLAKLAVKTTRSLLIALTALAATLIGIVQIAINSAAIGAFFTGIVGPAIMSVLNPIGAFFANTVGPAIMSSVLSPIAAFFTGPVAAFFAGPVATALSTVGSTVIGPVASFLGVSMGGLATLLSGVGVALVGIAVLGALAWGAGKLFSALSSSGKGFFANWKAESNAIRSGETLDNAPSLGQNTSLQAGHENGADPVVNSNSAGAATPAAGNASTTPAVAGGDPATPSAPPLPDAPRPDAVARATAGLTVSNMSAVRTGQGSAPSSSSPTISSAAQSFGAPTASISGANSRPGFAASGASAQQRGAGVEAGSGVISDPSDSPSHSQ